MDTVSKKIKEDLIELFHSIRKEIQTGKVDSHITFEQNLDVFRIVKKIKNKDPVVKTYTIPQEDRDETMELRHQLEKIKKDDGFMKLIKAIRSNRNRIHTDEVWHKNIVSYVGETMDLDQLVSYFTVSKSDLDDILDTVRIEKQIQNTFVHKEEKNVALQSFFQALLSKHYQDTKNISDYHALQDLLIPNKIVHEVKDSEGNIHFQKDGDSLKGILQKTYSSIREFGTKTSAKTEDERVVGLIAKFVEYVSNIKEQNLIVTPLSIKIPDDISYVVVGNSGVRDYFGQGPWEAHKEGVTANIGGASLRASGSYEDSLNGLPIVMDGKLYPNRISAIMAYLLPNLEKGNIGEDTPVKTLWDRYILEYKKGKDARKKLLMRERSMLIQSFDSITHMWNEWKGLYEQGIKIVWTSKVDQKIILHHYGVMEMVLKSSSVNNAKSQMNQEALCLWIVQNMDWIPEIISRSDEYETRDVETLKKYIGDKYGINVSKNALSESNEIMKQAVKKWMTNTPVDWAKVVEDMDDEYKTLLGDSMMDALRNSKFSSPRVDERELVSFVTDYATPLFHSVKRENDELKSGDIDDSLIPSIILAYYLSILHPSLKNKKTTIVEINDARESSSEPLRFKVKQQDRDVIRQYMSDYSLADFELEVVEGEDGGASERKESVEIEDMEQDREEGEAVVRLWTAGDKEVRLIII